MGRGKRQPAAPTALSHAQLQVSKRDYPYLDAAAKSFLRLLDCERPVEIRPFGDSGDEAGVGARVPQRSGGLVVYGTDDEPDRVYIRARHLDRLLSNPQRRDLEDLTHELLHVGHPLAAGLASDRVELALDEALIEAGTRHLWRRLAELLGHDPASVGGLEQVGAYVAEREVLHALVAYVDGTYSSEALMAHDYIDLDGADLSRAAVTVIVHLQRPGGRRLPVLAKLLLLQAETVADQALDPAIVTALTERAFQIPQLPGAPYPVTRAPDGSERLHLHAGISFRLREVIDTLTDREAARRLLERPLKLTADNPYCV
jgi:hypothetical protein